MTPKWAGYVALSAGALLLAACGSSANNENSASGKTKTITIGDINSLSGTAAAAGIGLANSEDVAADRINAAGGFKIGDTTYKLKVKRYDDAGTAEGGVAAMTKMVQQDGIHFMVGTVASSAAGGMLPVIQRHKDDLAVIWTGASAAEDVGPSNAFRMAISSPNVVKAHADYAKTQGWTTAVDVVDSTNPGQVAATGAFKKDLEANGIKLVGSTSITRGQTDFTSLITKMRPLNPSFVELRLYPDDEVTLIKQARETGWNVPFLVVSNLVPDSVASLPPNQVTQIHQAGWATIQDLISANISGAQQLFDDYKAKWKDDPGFLTMNGVEGINAMVAAMKQAQSIDPKDVVKALASLKHYDGMIWPLKPIDGNVFGPDRETGVPIAVSVWENGKLTFKQILQ